MKHRAVVLAGGGFAASAWELGLITGMADAGLDVRYADLFVGTSSGSRVALHLASDVAHDVAFERRLQPGPPSSERPAVVDHAAIREGIARAKQSCTTSQEYLRALGTLALTAAGGVDGATRREIVATQLPMRTWPGKRVLITAIDAERGERRAFDRDSGIDLVDAVIATTASFGWPLIEFEGHHYFDGGYYSSDNADLAAGYDRVLILALKRPPGIPAMSFASLEDGVHALRSSGASVEVIQPDDETLAAFAAAGGVMNPGISAPAAEAGRLQGRRVVTDRLLSFWK